MSSKPKTAKVETPAPIRPPKKSEQSLRVQYTEKELLEIGKKLAEANRELSQADNERKSVGATLKAKCDSISARIEQHSGELTNGYTYRSIPCETRFDCPTKGMKQTVRLDSAEIITTEAMTLHEMQAELNLGAGSTATEDDGIRRSTAANGVVACDSDDDSFTAGEQE